MLTLMLSDLLPGGPPMDMSCNWCCDTNALCICGIHFDPERYTSCLIAGFVFWDEAQHIGSIFITYYLPQDRFQSICGIFLNLASDCSHKSYLSCFKVKILFTRARQIIRLSASSHTTAIANIMTLGQGFGGYKTKTLLQQSMHCE